MGRIVDDIVDNVNEIVDENIKIESKKSKNLIKIIISISITLIGLSFTVGQFRSTIINEMNSFKSTLITQTISINELENKINNGFENTDKRIDKIYTDGLDAFDKYQQFNKEQLILILDYGQENKEMLKKMLELNSIENKNDVQNQIEKAKKDNEKSYDYQYENKIVAIPIKSKVSDYVKLNFIPNNDTDTTFYLIGATLEYVDKINKNQYEIEELKKNKNYNHTYDVIYKNK